MPAPLSIIIPARDAAAELPACLESLMIGLEAALIREVILVDAGSADGTIKIAEATGARAVPVPSEGGAQIAAGAHAARGEWLMFLLPSVALSRDWTERAGDHIDSRPGSAACFELRYRADEPAARRLERAANRRIRSRGLPLPEQGLLISSHLYRELSAEGDMNIDGLMKRLGAGRIVQLNAETRVSAAVFMQHLAKAKQGGVLRTLRGIIGLKGD